MTYLLTFHSLKDYKSFSWYIDIHTNIYLIIYLFDSFDSLDH